MIVIIVTVNVIMRNQTSEVRAFHVQRQEREIKGESECEVVANTSPTNFSKTHVFRNTQVGDHLVIFDIRSKAQCYAVNLNLKWLSEWEAQHTIVSSTPHDGAT